MINKLTDNDKAYFSNKDCCYIERTKSPSTVRTILKSKFGVANSKISEQKELIRKLTTHRVETLAKKTAEEARKAEATAAGNVDLATAIQDSIDGYSKFLAYEDKIVVIENATLTPLELGAWKKLTAGPLKDDGYLSSFDCTTVARSGSKKRPKKEPKPVITKPVITKPVITKPVTGEILKHPDTKNIKRENKDEGHKEFKKII